MRVLLFSSSRVFVVLVAVLLLRAAPAMAQESPAFPKISFEVPVELELRPVEPPRKRPAALMPLYGSLVGLQGLDIHSTRRGMSSKRTREANPLMGSVVNNGAALMAVKTASTAGAIWAAERLWKKNRKGAVVFTVLMNATMAAVVTHNYRAAR